MENKLSFLDLFALGVVAGIVYWVYRDVKSKANLTMKDAVPFGVRG